MAAISSQLGRIGALVDKLDPLRAKRRGMRIEADEWNALVDVVGGMLELERAQESSLQSELEEEFSPKNHHHIGEIGIESLDPELQARFSADGGGVATRITVSDLQTKLDGLGTEVGRLSTLVESLQTQLDRAAVEDLERGSKLRGFESRFAGIENLRGLVTGLSSQVGGLEPGIAAVLELRGSLGGIDVSDLRDRVTGLEQLSENGLGVDGKPLRLRDFELELKEIEDTLDLHPGSGLDDRIKALGLELDTKLGDKVDAGIAEAHQALEIATADTRAALATELGTKVDDVRSQLQQLTDERIGAAQVTLDASLTERVGTAAAALRDTLSAETVGLVETRLATLPAQVQEAATAAVAGARPGLRDEIAAALGVQIDTRLTAAEAAADARAVALDGKFADLDAQLPQRIAAETAEQLPGLVDARVAAASDSLGSLLGARVDQQLAQARDALAAGIQTEVGSAVSSALSDLDGRIVAQLVPRLADLDGRIASSVADALGDLSGRISTEVGVQIGKLELDSRFGGLQEQLTAQWRGELAAEASKLRDDGASALATAGEGLRAEIGKARSEVLSEALDRLEAMHASIENDIAALATDTAEQLRALEQRLTSQFNAGLEGVMSKLEEEFKGWLGEAIDGVRRDLAAMRDSLTADFEKQLETLDSRFSAELENGLQGVFVKAQSLVTNLANSVNPRLDRLEKAVFHETIPGTVVPGTVISGPG
jgi:hypothetical protein